MDEWQQHTSTFQRQVKSLSLSLHEVCERKQENYAHFLIYWLLFLFTQLGKPPEHTHTAVCCQKDNHIYVTEIFFLSLISRFCFSTVRSKGYIFNTGRVKCSVRVIHTSTWKPLHPHLSSTRNTANNTISRWFQTVSCSGELVDNSYEFVRSHS